MTEKVNLPSAYALGLDMSPTRKYNPVRGREGVVEVSDEDAALLRKYTALQVGERFSAPTASYKVCSGCGFSQYSAMTGESCTRCGGTWISAEPKAERPVQSGRRKTYDI